MTIHKTTTATGERTVAPSSLTGLPLMLTVGEVAAVLRISRTSAYKLAQEWRASQGATGLPTVRLGSRVMVRRVDLSAIVGLGPDE
jgi:Helix-turn-helix domain